MPGLRDRNPTRHFLPELGDKTKQNLGKSGLLDMGRCRGVPQGRQRPKKKRSEMTREELREEERRIRRHQVIRREKRSLAQVDGEREQKRRDEENMRWHEARRMSQIRSERLLLYMRVFSPEDTHTSAAGLELSVRTTEPSKVHPAFCGRVCVKRVQHVKAAGAARAPKHHPDRYHPALLGFEAYVSDSAHVSPVFFGKVVEPRDWNVPINHAQDPEHFSSKLVVSQKNNITTYHAIGMELQFDHRRDVFSFMSPAEQAFINNLRSKIYDNPDPQGSCAVCQGDGARGCPSCFDGRIATLRLPDRMKGRPRPEDTDPQDPYAAALRTCTRSDIEWSYQQWRAAVVNHRERFTCPMRVMVKSIPTGQMCFLNVDADDTLERLHTLFRTNCHAGNDRRVYLLLPTMRGLFNLEYDDPSMAYEGDTRAELKLRDLYMRSRGCQLVMLHVHSLSGAGPLHMLNNFIGNNVVELRDFKFQTIEYGIDGVQGMLRPCAAAGAEADTWLAKDPLQRALFAKLSTLQEEFRRFAREEAAADLALQVAQKKRAFLEKRERDLDQKKKIVARRKQARVVEEAWTAVNQVRSCTLQDELLLQAWFQAYQIVRYEINLPVTSNQDVYDCILGETEMAMVDMLGLPSSSLPFRVVSLSSGLIMFIVGDLTSFAEDEAMSVRQVFGLSLADMPGVLTGTRQEHELDATWNRASQLHAATNVGELLRPPFITVPWGEMAAALKMSLSRIFHLKLELDDYETSLRDYRRSKAARYFDTDELHSWRKKLQKVVERRGMLRDEAVKLLADVKARLATKETRKVVVNRPKY